MKTIAKPLSLSSSNFISPFFMKVVAILALAGSSLFTQCQNPSSEPVNSKVGTSLNSASKVEEKRKQYDAVLANLKQKRENLAAKYRKAATEAEKQAVLKEAGQILVSRLTNDILPAWNGTGWDFNGTSNQPGEGVIACGYFVSTPLKHCGFELNRYRIAQQYATVIIKLLCPERPPKRIGHNNVKGLVTYFEGQPNGLYIIGLDNHVGFIHKQGGAVDFVHSNYIEPAVVTREPVATSRAIKASQNYVVGYFLPNSSTVNKWLLGTSFVVPKS